MRTGMRRLHADLILVACAAIWGFAFLFQKSAMEHVGPFTFVAARSVVACLALAPLALLEGRREVLPISAQLPRVAVLAGLAFFAGAAFQQVGLITATVTNSSFLTALYVVLTPLVAWVLMGRQPTLIVVVAVVLSFVGTWFLGGGSLAAFQRGDWLVAISALFWATHVVCMGLAAPLGRPVLFTALQFAVVAVLAAAVAILTESVSLANLGRAAIDIAFVGLLSSALTFTLFTMALRHTSPTEAAIIVSTETLFATLGGYVFAGDRLSTLGIFGAGLILAAILLVQLAPATRQREAPQA